jgi:hypothetical protein
VPSLFSEGRPETGPATPKAGGQVTHSRMMVGAGPIRATAPNKAFHLTAARILVSRGILSLQRAAAGERSRYVPWRLPCENFRDAS